MIKHLFHISGTHCPSCKIFIEEKLAEEAFVAEVDLKKETLTLVTHDEQPLEDLTKILTSKIKANGYAVWVERPDRLRTNPGLMWKALPIGLGFLVLFFWLQKSGILNIGLGGQVTPVTSFIIGLIASVSSCLAVVGGLVLSLSAKISQDEINDTKTFVLFHGGRLAGFTLLGGALGLIGETIGINFIFTTTLGLLASVIMVLLGLNLVGVFAKSKIVLPPAVFNFFRKVEHQTFAPLILGLATFFLPCGFTQAMQIAALSSGSLVTGSLIMLAFALGTLPVLTFLSFGSASFAHGRHAPLFFKSAGVVVIGLGLFALLSGLAGLGIINPLFNI